MQALVSGLQKENKELKSEIAEMGFKGGAAKAAAKKVAK